MPNPDEVVFLGFHGTCSQGAVEIINSTFKFLPSPEDWLGSGVYFFIDGISCPMHNAHEWSVNKFGTSSGVVLKSNIIAPSEKVLDLTTHVGLKKYNSYRNDFLKKNKFILEKRRDLGIKKRKDIRLDDKIVTEVILTQLSVSVLIHNVYIKNSLQRKLEMESSYPNATVCSVRDLSLLKDIQLVDHLNLCDRCQ